MSLAYLLASRLAMQVMARARDRTMPIVMVGNTMPSSWAFIGRLTS
ncbi:MAG: hypothetical protein PVF51_09685 [Nitrospirota bacterium]|jgi:hypothetical protein